MRRVVYLISEIVSLINKLRIPRNFKISFLRFYKSEKSKSFKVIIIEVRSEEYGKKASDDL